MKLPGFLRAIAGRSPRQTLRVVTRFLRAGYDAAKTTEENRRHWADADHLSADGAANPDVRRRLRMRSRYEVANNSYAEGIVSTLANDAIGTGPRVQFPGDTDGELARAFAAWAQAIDLPDKLRTMRRAKAVDGEAFAVLGVNPGVGNAVTLDLRLIEADQVCTPDLSFDDPLAVDGIRFDQYGSPVEYAVLKQHPGASLAYLSATGEYDLIAAELVLHYFDAKRPGQSRGIPELTPALSLLPILRRYTLAVLGAAEAVAGQALILETQSPPLDDDDAEVVDLPPFDTQEFDRITMTSLPAGWKMSQPKAEQPTTQYPAFVQQVIKEIARCLNLPYNIAAGDSSGYNYSSGRLDHQTYGRAIDVERGKIEQLLDRILSAWLKSAVLVEGLIPPAMRGAASRGELPEHTWFWDGRPHVDPSKEAAAQKQRLENKTTTLADEWAAQGWDWREKLEQLAAEAAVCEELGLPPPWDLAPAPPAADVGSEDEELDNQEARAMNRRPMIRAAKSRAAGKSITLTCPAQIQAEAAQDGKPAKRPTFSAAAYNGGSLRLGGFYLPVVIDLSSLKASPRVPILRDHDSTQIVGQATDVSISSKTVRLAGIFTGTDDAESPAGKVLGHAKDGFEWQVSVGVDPGSIESVKAGTKVKVNGRTFDGPLLVARNGRLREVSFVAVGADETASAKVAAEAAKGNAMDFTQWLLAMGLVEADLTEEQLTKLRAKYTAEMEASGADGAEGEGEESEEGAAPARRKRKVKAKAKRKLRLVRAAADAEGEEDDAGDDEGAEGDSDAEGEEDGDGDDIEAGGGDITTVRAEYRRITKIEQLCGEEHPKICARAIDEGWSVERVQAELWRAGRASVNAIIRNTGGPSADVLQAAACMTGGLRGIEKQFDARTLEAAHKRFRGTIGLQELILEAAWMNGYQGRSFSRDMRGVLKAAFSTVSLPGILSATANKFILEGWMGVEQTWRAISAKRTVRDFKRVTSYRLTGDMKYEKLAPDGEIKHGELGEEDYGNQADTYAKMLAITRKMLINDDMDALSRIPRMLGRGGALKLNEVFWTEFMNNGSFFTTGNKNYEEGAGTAFGVTGLTSLELLFLNQVDPDGNPLGVTPKILLVPNALNTPAAVLMKSAELRDTTASTKYVTSNPHAGKYEVQRSSYLSNTAITGNSTKAYYLLADPVEEPVIETAFLNGQEMPTVETADVDFNQLGIQMRGYHDFGVEKQSTRGGAKSKGEA